MEIVIVLLLGILQGVFGFFPVSMQGVQAVFGTAFSMGDTALLYCVFFHVGTALLLSFYIKEDLLRMPADLARVLYVQLKNGKGLLLARFGQEDFEPANPFASNHERFSAMAGLALLVALPFSLLLRPLAIRAFHGPLYVGVGYMIMTVVLLVGGMLKVRNRLPMNTRVLYGALAGLLLAAGIFPGISALGILFVFGMIIGFNRQTAQRFSCICFVLASFASLPVLLLTKDAGSVGTRELLYGLLGLAVTFAVGVFLSNRALRMAKIIRVQKLALVSGALAVGAIILGFLLRV